MTIKKKKQKQVNLFQSYHLSLPNSGVSIKIFQEKILLLIFQILFLSILLVYVGSLFEEI